MFVKGDRVRLNEKGRAGSPPHAQDRLGTYTGESRDGECDLVRWDGVKKQQGRRIVKGHIEKVD